MTRRDLVALFDHGNKDDDLFAFRGTKNRASHALASLGSDLEQSRSERGSLRPAQIRSELLDQLGDSQKAGQNAGRKGQRLLLYCGAIVKRSSMTWSIVIIYDNFSKGICLPSASWIQIATVVTFG